ncbi:MAG: hypothetical protein K2K46_03065 [Lachnospiraceae bacterium]|nr:hypothetical protein [Lachnospiraceae bacterium]
MKGSKLLAGMLSVCMLFGSLPVEAMEPEIRVGMEAGGSYSLEADGETDGASGDMSDGGNGNGEAALDEENSDKDEEVAEAGAEDGVDDEAIVDERTEEENEIDAEGADASERSDSELDGNNSVIDDVEINEENFPDDVFREYVSKNFDTNKDDVLSEDEIGSVTGINVIFEGGVKSFKGIENFVNLKSLDCTFNQLDNLDVSNNTALESLDCTYNNLTELNISNNTALKELRCDNNNLTKLNVSNNIALERLVCNNNNLTELNVSNNTALKELTCDSNNLTELDVSNNTALESLSCSDNNLTKLNVSNSAALEGLDCSDNNLTELNVSNKTALKYLWCNNNKIAELNVNNNTALEELSCNNNKLTELYLSDNSKLGWLYCNSNELQSLDVSNCIELCVLECKGNKLTRLDLSKNIKLCYINCKSNALEELILPENNELYYLNCGNNKLTSLDVSRYKELDHLYCDRNQLESLNLSQNVCLCLLNCSNTGLKELDLSQNKDLYSLYCSDNVLTSLDLSQNTNLQCLECNNNNLTSLDLSKQEYLHWLKCNGNSRLKSVDMRDNKYTISDVEEDYIKIGMPLVTTICCTEGSGIDYYCKLNYLKYSYGAPSDIPNIGDSTVSGNNPTVSGNDSTVSGNNPTVSGNNMPIIYGDIKDAEIILSNSCIKAKKNNAAQKPIPKKVTLSGRTLKNNKDYIVSYAYIYNDENGKAVKENVEAITKAGSYEIVLTAKAGGRYTGSQSIPILAADINKTLMSTVKVTLEKNKYNYKDYIGQEIKPVIKSVKSGKKSLTEGKDYIVSYTDNTSSGKGKVILTAVSDSSYAGIKEVAFDITGIKMSKVKVTGITTPIMFNGKGNITQDLTKIKLTYNGKDVYGKTVSAELTEGTDYTVSYENNNSAGTAKIVFKGKGFYNGVLKKNFKISKVALTKNMLAAGTIEATHSKAGAKPDVTLTYNDKKLINGIDYTISYKKNKAVSSSRNKPMLTIKGKGDYSGSIKNIEFSIAKKDINSDAISVIVPDVAYNKKKSAYITKLKVYDNGALIKVNKDYTIEYANNNISTLPTAGRTEVSVTIKGIGNYSGSRTESFYVVEKLISGLSAKVNGNHVYDGIPVTLDKSEIVIIDKKNNNHILTSDEFDIINYAANTHVGTAKVEVRGLGKYGGTKIIKFKITKKK